MITSYETMPIGIYQRMVEIATNGREDDENAVEIVAALSGKTEEELLNMPITDFQALSAQCGFIHTQPKIGKPKKRRQLGSFDCVVDLDPEQLTTAQYIDFKELAPKANEHIEVLLSVFLIPKGKRYNEGYNMRELHKAILEHLPITEAQSILAFFLRRLQRLTESTLIFSAALMKAQEMRMTGEKKEQMKELMKKMTEAIHSYKNGGGDTSFTLCLGLPILLGARSTDTK